jgi:hypothetical protein
MEDTMSTCKHLQSATWTLRNLLSIQQKIGMMFEPMDFERQWSTTSLRPVALAGLGGVG